jgi:hypothetical protein
MHRFYDRSAANDAMSTEEASIRLLTPLKLTADVTRNEDNLSAADRENDPKMLGRQRSDDFNSSATFIPWHESEALQTSKLRSAIIEVCTKHP